MKKYISNIPEYALLVITTTVVLILVAEVIFRYFIGTSLDWIEEISRILLIWLAFIGAAVAVKRNEHIAIHYFLSFFSRQMQRRLELFTYSAIVFFSIFLFIQGIIFAALSIDTTFPALQVTNSWLYIGLPIGCFLMILYGLTRLINTIKTNRIQK
jgi:TRAP-type transport system small permease protein